MALSKVKGVQASGSFENAYGAVQDNPELPNHGKKLLYKFEYVMEDGVVITANHKTNTSPFPQGSEVEYTVVKDDPQHGKSGKVTKPGASNYNNTNSQGAPRAGVGEDLRQLMIVRQSSLKVALDLLIHNSNVEGVNSMVNEIDVIGLAGSLQKWVMLPEKKEEKKVEEVAAASNIGVEKEEPSDDLPF